MEIEKIYFPSVYKKAILKRTKSFTIRVDKELGKYKKGHIYQAFSYTDSDWETKIKIKELIKIKLSELVEFGIPKRSVKSLKRKTILNDNDLVELIKFNYVSKKGHPLAQDRPFKK